MDNNGRRLFNELSADEQRATRRDMGQMLAACLVVCGAWVGALHLADLQQEQVEMAREETRFAVHARATALAQREVQDYWVPRVAEAYARGARDECERQRLVRGNQLPCGVQ